jgi:two-component system LytT family response regulator
MRVLIIDDEPLARRLLRTYCEKIEDIEILGECENGFDAVKVIDEQKPDLIFLDIQMPKLNGFEVLELIVHQPKVIFSTAFDEHAVHAFEVNALDYLLKPFLFDRFEQAYIKCKESLEVKGINQGMDLPKITDEDARIVIKEGDKISILPLADVIHIEAYDDYVKIFTDDHRYVKKQTMSHYEKSLPGNLFFRVHRSHIIAINRIQAIENADKGKHQVLLTNGQRFPISRSAYPKLKTALGW